ncbi:uncharacterized protein BCR38DRAFT_343510 [Pseudomassariella vexata]|uniref:RING-type E3 ubiquitin transferase n=1 Tax=Pseudomassariella vexata TaxID=1141098 RepID=A0A1Y2DXW1_9PEZI|nr:uncharacterized protein BCR38DRAFT_343510 [Pseudomassariella vexata]ORY64077.1 hypothetical protein BCR38DRAFT_343510 [Pseudomassariella vexata]
MAFVAALLPAVAAGKATTSALTQVPGYYTKFQMKLSLTASEGPLDVNYPITPLTQQEGLNTSNLNYLRNIGVEGTMVVVDQSNFNNINGSDVIAYLSCDSNDDSYITQSNMLDSLMTKQLEAIVLYSIKQSCCSLGGNDLAYGAIWTMLNPGESGQARNWTTAATGTIRATISGNITSDNDAGDGAGGNNSAVAMSILYSITGLITLLFLVIIGTGAIRAHRHPERYGPRAGHGGQPRQSRARGLARAVLETLPIVKFGDPHPVKGDPENELESISSDPRPETAVPVQRSTTNEATNEARPSVSVEKRARGTTETMSGAVGTVGQRPTSEDHAEDEHPGCTICTEDFTVGEDVRVLPCDHKFHPACIDPWLINVSGTCPLCRLDLHSQGAVEGEEARSENGQLPGDSLSVEDVNDTDAAQRRRRSRLLDWNRLRHASVDERIRALRQFREQQDVGSAQGLPSERGPHPTFTDRLREKFHVRTTRT